MHKEVLGIDMGGSHLRAGLVRNNQLLKLISRPVAAGQPAELVTRDLFDFINSLMTPDIKAIGIGVPGIVRNGTVYDVVNIPSWKEIRLQQLMQDRFQLPVAVNNDANCFALAEFRFGKGRGHDSMIGLTIGTGLGSGLILDGKLYNGSNGGAGEFGMIDYLDRCYEYYASGQFFPNVHGVSGEQVFQEALAGEAQALSKYEEMGHHLGNALKTMLYAVDVPLIVLGGSVSRAYSFFSKAMWRALQGFAFQRSLEQVRIEVSELDHGGVLGAAALCLEGSSTYSL